MQVLFLCLLIALTRVNGNMLLPLEAIRTLFLLCGDKFYCPIKTGGTSIISTPPFQPWSAINKSKKIHFSFIILAHDFYMSTTFNLLSMVISDMQKGVCGLWTTILDVCISLMYEMWTTEPFHIIAHRLIHTTTNALGHTIIIFKQIRKSTTSHFSCSELCFLSLSNVLIDFPRS